MHLSLIIPVYHEEKNIEKLLKQIESLVKTSHETLIVYDSKSDPTFNVVKKIGSKYKNIKLIENKIGSKKGVINAVKTGISMSRGTTIAIVMADLSDDISAIDKMYDLILHGYDIVAASRYTKGGKKIGGPLLKTFLSKIAGVSLYYLFKIPTHDATNAFKMYRKKLFNEITIESTGGFEYSLEIVLKAHKLGYRITEIPTVWYDRMEGKSNFKLLSWLPKYVRTYLIVMQTRSNKKKGNKQIANVKKKFKSIDTDEHIAILGISSVISVFLYLILITAWHFKFSNPATQSINWLTVYHYPKQQDYFFFYTFFSFIYLCTLIIWILWISLKVKR